MKLLPSVLLCCFLLPFIVSYGQTNGNLTKPAVPVHPNLYSQPDVFVFRMVNGIQYAGIIDYTCVDQLEYRGQYRDQLNIIYFNSTCTEAQKVLQISRIKNTPSCPYDRDFKVTSIYGGLLYTAKQFMIEEDIVSVVFNVSSLKSMNDITLFAQRNNLTLINKPQICTTSGFSGIYDFKLNNLTEYSRDKSILIKNNEAMVSAISPLITNYIKRIYDESEIYTRTPTDLKMATTTCSKNDFLLPYQWSIYNDGSLYYQGNTLKMKATAGADAKICDCWNSGYTGSGVKIAVMDGAGVQLSYADMKGQYGNGVNFQNAAFPNGTPITTDIIPANSSVKGYDHMMNTSGIIGSLNNNNYGVAGVAPSASISPLLIDYNNAITFHNAFNYLTSHSNEYDVLNMSFSMVDNTSLHAAITYLATNGRTTTGGTSAGMILVASAGNEGQNIANYPAAYEEVIGVMNSNPNDFRHNYNDGWSMEKTGGSTYGYYYDIAAPGTFMFVNTYAGKGTCGLSPDHNISTGTSFSAPLVAGIAAMILQKNRTISYSALKSILQSSADKVNSAAYNYKANTNYVGKSLEMGYGRVNCLNALKSTPMAMEYISSPNKLFELNTLVHDRIDLHYSGTNLNSINYSILDMYGQVISSDRINLSSSNVIDASNFTDGIYILNLYDSGSQLSVSYKIVKTN